MIFCVKIYTVYYSKCYILNVFFKTRTTVESQPPSIVYYTQKGKDTPSSKNLNFEINQLLKIKHREKMSHQKSRGQ